MSKKIFISHATIDRHLVDILIKFLATIGIQKNDIFCTSVGSTLESGKNFIEQIKSNVQDSKVVLFLLSERFFSSCFCLAELGAAWALNQNVLPIIVPPISTAEYNRTPLLGIQALNIGNADFVESFLNDLSRKGIIESADTGVKKSKAMHEFNVSVKKELGILRKDASGFYVARLIDKKSHQEAKAKQMPCHQLGIISTTCNYTELQTTTYWKLNGLLDEETDPNITEHWIYGGQVNLSGSRIQFELGDTLEQGKNYRIFSVKTYYELP